MMNDFSRSQAPPGNEKKRYYAFLAGAIAGPYAIDELKPIAQPGLLVCLEGAEGWTPIETVPELATLVGPAAPVSAPPPVALAPMPAEDLSPPKDLPPKLQELWRICRNAPDELLREQKAKFWKEFFKNEKEIIAAELARRGIN